MKKIMLLIMFLSFLVGCSLANTPTSRVEDLLSKYQKVDNEIKMQINNISNNDNLTEDQKERYKKLIKKQYSNLSYQIKDEEIDGNNATVTVEIIVLDYKKTVNKTNETFMDKQNYSSEEYNNVKLKNLENTKEKVTYTINFNVQKDKNDNWQINELDEETIKKIQGMY